MASEFERKESKESGEKASNLFDRVKAVLESGQEFSGMEGAYSIAVLEDLDEKDLKKRIHTLHGLQRELATERENMAGGWVPAWSPAFVIPTKVREIQDYERKLQNLSNKVEGILSEKVQEREKKSREKDVAKRLADRELQLEKLEKAEFEPEGFFNKLFSNMMNGYFVDVLLPYEALELQRKQEYLDELYKSGLQEGDTSALKTALSQAQRTVSGVASTAAALVDETTSGLGKGISLALAWPYALPVKLFNAVVKWALEKPSFMLGAGFEVINDSIPTLPLQGNFREEPLEFIKNNFLRILGNVGLGIVKAPFAIPEGVFKGAGYLLSTVRHVIDFDNWPKMFSPVTSGFIRGGLGVAVLVAVALAGIPTLGIVPAMWAVAAGLAAVGSVVAGIWGAKKKARELSSLKLPEKEELELVKWRRTHRPEAEVDVKAERKVGRTVEVSEAEVVRPESQDKVVKPREMKRAQEQQEQQEQVAQQVAQQVEQRREIEGKPDHKPEIIIKPGTQVKPEAKPAQPTEPPETTPSLQGAVKYMGTELGPASPPEVPAMFFRKVEAMGTEKESKKQRKARVKAERAASGASGAKQGKSKKSVTPSYDKRPSYDKKDRAEERSVKPSDEQPDAAPPHHTPEA